MIKTWKGKSSDLFLVMLYFILYSIGVHILVSIRHAFKYNENVFESIKNPGSLLLSIVVIFFFMSPAWVYFRKVPKLLKIDFQNKKLEVHRRRKTLKYNMDKIRFYTRNTRFFYILEIHATFETSRNGQFEKLATSIIVPNWGLSWNKKKMEEIVNEFRIMEIEEIKYRPPIPLAEYFYN